jgi:predicted molibdopterin-dependent oxidoreductase YjgC
MNTLQGTEAAGGGQFQRVGEQSRPAVAFFLDGRPASALLGDTVLTAVLTQVRSVRRNEFSQQPRAGFCVMGACQDCWMKTADGRTVRACSTPIAPGMQLLSGARQETP